MKNQPQTAIKQTDNVIYLPWHHSSHWLHVLAEAVEMEERKDFAGKGKQTQGEGRWGILSPEMRRNRL